jgi:hypothetical protein
VDEVEEETVGHLLLMALMYWMRLKTLWTKSGGSLHTMADGCMWLRLMNK